MTILITILTLLTIASIVTIPRVYNPGSPRSVIFLLQVLAVEGALVVGVLAYTFTY